MVEHKRLVCRVECQCGSLSSSYRGEKTAQSIPNRASSQIKVLGTLFFLFCLRGLRAVCPSSCFTVKKRVNLRSGVCLLLSAYMLLMFFSATAHAQTLRFATDSDVEDTTEKIIRGRLEYSNGQGVCDDYFTDDDAMVACYELGYVRGNARAVTKLTSSGNGDFWLDNLVCDGTEDALGDCDKAGSAGNGGGEDGDHNCRDSEHTGVVCYTEVVIPKAMDLDATPHPESEGTAILSWTAPKIKFTGQNIDYIESIVDKYELQISEDGVSGWTDVSTNIVSTRTNFHHTGLSPGTWYYRIRAVNTTAGDGPYSDVADVTLGGNRRPVFSEGTSATRSVEENTVAGEDIGGPVAATGSESYLLGGTDANSFDIDGTTGQLKIKVALDYEDRISYSVTVTAQHNGSATSINVTITVTNVDELGAVTFSYPSPFQVNEVLTATLSDPDGPVSGETWIWERSLNQNSGWTVIPGATSASYTVVVGDEDNYLRATATYTDAVFGFGKTAQAVSNKVPNLNWPPMFEIPPPTFSIPENSAAEVEIGTPVTAADPEMDPLTYSLDDTDGTSFDIDSSTGQIETKAPLDYETKDVYSVTVTARDRPVDDPEVESDTITVTINVTNEDDPGELTLSSVQPQVDTLLEATLTDPDGSVTGETWVWEKSSSRTNGWSTISGATSASYTPVAGDVDNYLRAKVTYTDRHGPNKMAYVVSDLVVRVEPPSNNAPSFQSSTATRSVDENTPPGRNVGAPVTATDPDTNDTLTYSLEGPDTASFALADPTSGQIKTKAPLDYEGPKNSYSVTVKATDPSGLYNTIEVTINVRDVDESVSPPSTTKSPSQITRSTPTATVPRAPASLTATPGDAEVALNWRAPGDGGSAIKYYEYNIDGGAWTSTGGKSTSYTATGLTNGETYKFRVRAVNSVGPGAESKPASAVPATVPGAPRNLTLTSGSQYMTLIWERPADNGGLPITGYEYSQKEEDGSFGEWTPIDNSAPGEANDTTYAVTGLKNGTIYSFRVRAVNTIGPGDPSAEATAEVNTPSFRRAKRASLNILPTFGRTMLRNSVDALTWRLDSVLSGSFERTGMFRLMDQHVGLHEVIGDNIWDDPDQWEDLSLEELLYGSSFIIEAGVMLKKPKEHPKEDPKGYAGEDSKEGPKEYIREYPEEDSADKNMWIDEDEKPMVAERRGGIGFWGKADYNNLSVSSDEWFTWDGRIVSGYMGVDRWLNEKVLTGLSVSLTKGDFDYTDTTPGEGGRGDYYVKMLSVSPYVSWFLSDDAYIWGAVGYGRGEIDIDDEEVQSVATSDLSYKSVAAGGSGRLFDVGDTTFSLKSEAFKVWMDVEGDDYLIDEMSLGVHQLRLSMEGSYEYRFASGTWFNPLVEVALRRDGGDGETGTGVELGGGFLYEDPNLGLSVSGRGRWLAAHSSDEFSQWGVGGAVIFDTGADKRGALFSVSPEWGDTSSGVDSLWERGVEGLSSEDGGANDMHLDAEFGYGLSALGGDGLFTPYSGLRVGGDGWRQYRLGSRLDLGRSASLSLETDRRQSDTTKPEHGIMLRGKLNF